MNLPTLYKKTSTGKIQEWTITVTGSSTPDAQIRTTYGQVGGKLQQAVESITEGKNVGKANETTPYEQAVLEARSQWEKKIKKGYVQTPEDAEADKIDTNFITGGVDPMLAHKYHEQGHKIKWPAYVQPKLDGHRCIAIIQDGKCTLWSRTRKRITSMTHIVRELEERFPDRTLVLDGELYNHDYKDKFEKLTSKIRKSTPTPGSEVVQYWVYDIVSENPFEDRTAQIAELGFTGDPIVTVPTVTAKDEEEMISIFGVYIDAGFEGLMVRNSASLYKGKRSYDLQKVKVMQDAEFKIKDVEHGKGRMADCAIFVCQVKPDDPDKVFRVKMMGSLDNLAEIYKNREQYVGKDLTVKYQKLSAEGIPVFPIGVRIREDV